MPYDSDSRPDREERPVSCTGRVSRPPTTLSDTMAVVLPDYGPAYPFDVAAGHWMPRGALLPTANAQCLVVFDDEGDAWVPAWSHV